MNNDLKSSRKISRPLNAEETELIQKDLEELYDFCHKFGLYGSVFRERLNGLNFQISYLLKDKEYGNADHFKHRISLKEDVFTSDYIRKSILYHEIAHLVFDLDAMGSSVNISIKNRVVEENKKYNNPNDGGDCLVGIRLIKEYICEKFSTLATNAVLNQKIIKSKKNIHAISGDYEYTTSFNSAYGVFETLIDRLLLKKYNKIYNVFIDCLNSTLYAKLLNEYDPEYFTKCLTEMGRIYNKLYAFIHNEGQVYLDETITKNLFYLDSYINSLTLKENSNSPVVKK